MLTQVTTVLCHTGLPPASAAALATVVVEPPPGSIAVAELRAADTVRLTLLAAIVAATDLRQFGTALHHLVGGLHTAQPDMTDYDAGRFWHLQGVVAWRLEQAFAAATRALNRSLTFLQGVPSPEAQAYLARVYDTFGQLLHYQGLLSEARRELELALRHRDPADAEGTALTLGNLGRLCLDLGDFAGAAAAFRQDLALVTRQSPAQTVLCTQLWSHLGTCALEAGHLAEAQEAFTQSATLAAADGNATGLTFAAVGLGRLAYRQGDLAAAQRQVTAAWTHLQAVAGAPALQAGLRGLIGHLQGDLHLAAQQPAQAIATYQEALQQWTQMPLVSPVERAQLLWSLARAQRQHGDGQAAAAHLREALHLLEPTTATQLRQAIETELQTAFAESWLFHTAGRFLGPRHQTAWLLREAGQGGFRGERQDVVVLFADIRGFTTLAEQLEPAQLITCLNEYLGHMTRCVDMFGGLVDKFIGDAVMAVFSLPTPQPDDAERAVQAALTMRDELERFNRGLPAAAPPLAIGLGLHCGPVVAGLIGSSQKRAYTVIGDAVNTAARLEGLTRHLGASLLVSQDVLGQVPHPERYLCRPLGTYALKGKHTAMAVVDIMGEDDGSRFARALAQEIAAVIQACEAFKHRQFTAAQAAFVALEQATAAAGHTIRAQGYQFLAETARTYQALLLPPDWEGTIIMQEK